MSLWPWAVAKVTIARMDNKITSGFRTAVQMRASQSCFFSCATSLGPYVPIRAVASSWLKPSGVVLSRCKISDVSWIAASRTRSAPGWFPAEVGADMFESGDVRVADQLQDGRGVGGGCQSLTESFIR